MGPQPRTTVREFRKNLATALGSGKVIAVGTPVEIRAFLIAVPKHNQSDQKEKRKALRAALKALRAAIQAEMLYPAPDVETQSLRKQSHR